LELVAAAGVGTVLGGALAWWSTELFRAVLPVALALSAAAMLYVAVAQSARILAGWPARIRSLECGLSFVAGVVIIGGSHQVLEFFG
jgi:zinc transporter ZupT